MKAYVWGVVVSALLLGGCGELSYKRGASTQDLEAAKKTCTEAGRDRPAEDCLAAQGWTVKKLDDIDLFATAAVSPDNRNPSQFVIPAWVPVIPAAAADPKASPPAPTATAPTATATTLTAPPAAPATRSGAMGNANSSSAATSPAPAAQEASNTMAPAPASPASPLDVYTISSWWKVGADREALAADTQACVAELGSAHKPNAVTQQVTRGFVVCMHDKGWKALRAVAG